jgi:hypothetical protein
VNQAPGIEFICGSGLYVRRFLHRENDAIKIVAFKQMIRKFVKTFAVHTAGIKHGPILLIDTLFSCPCPFKKVGPNFLKFIFL